MLVKKVLTRQQGKMDDSKIPVIQQLYPSLTSNNVLFNVKSLDNMNALVSACGKFRSVFRDRFSRH